MDDLFTGNAWLGEPVDQAIERRQTEGKAKAAMPVIEDLIARLEADIQDMQSISNARAEAMASGKSIELIIEALDMATVRLNNMKEYLEQLRDEYK